MTSDSQLLFFVVFLVLAVASAIGQYLKKFKRTEKNAAVIENLIQRINAWWVMVGILLVSFFGGKIGCLLIFAFASYVALDEMAKLLNLTRDEKIILYWLKFVIMPIQYLLIYNNWYGLFSIFIPVYAFLFIPLRKAMAENHSDFFSRSAKLQWSLMIGVYTLSHVPALLILKIPNFSETINLLFFVIFVCQVSDVCQYIWGKLFGRTKIAPIISPNKTVEGFLGGIITASLLGVSIYWITPFKPLAVFMISLTITLAGFAGGLVMSAIKRDQGIKDYGDLIHGHGGILDRMDSLTYAAPLFFHIVRYFYEP